MGSFKNFRKQDIVWKIFYLENIMNSNFVSSLYHYYIFKIKCGSQTQ